MTIQHTPGPWTVTLGDHGAYYLRAPDGGPVDPASDHHSLAECQANARLIAAAPDLLITLRHVTWIAGNWCQLPADRTMVQHAQDLLELFDPEQRERYCRCSACGIGAQTMLGAKCCCGGTMSIRYTR